MYLQRYNRTNFVSAAVASKIITAMRDAITTGHQQYVENKRGQRWLRVCIKPDGYSQGRYDFEFRAGNGQDVGYQIMQALFVWSSDHERMFSELLGELYSMTEHPYTVNRQKAIEREKQLRAIAYRDHLRKLGITHSFRTPMGVTHLGRWERNWWGRKRFVCIANAHGKAYGKAFTLDAESCLYGTIQGAFV